MPFNHCFVKSGWLCGRWRRCNCNWERWRFWRKRRWSPFSRTGNFVSLLVNSNSIVIEIIRITNIYVFMFGTCNEDIYSFLVPNGKNNYGKLSCQRQSIIMNDICNMCSTHCVHFTALKCTAFQPNIRGGICPCRHCWRQCKIFASDVNFSRNQHILLHN